MTFPQLDTEKVKAKLDLEKEGQKRGKSNLPPTTQTQPDDIEQKIASFMHDEVKAATEFYYDHLQSFEERINRLHAAGNVGTLDNIVTTTEGDFDAHVKKNSSNLYTARRSVRDSERDLKSFRKKNGLTSAAHYPSSRLLYFAVAFFLIAIETTINGQFFAQGHELGLVGGVFTALIPSLLNIFLGYYLGNFALRLAIHKTSSKRLAGIFCGLLIPCLMITINLLIAHYRSAMVNMAEAGSMQAAHDALISFAQTPLNLQDVDSWLLFGTGCVFCLIATIDFWKMDDPYPHYGEITREYEKKLQYYADLKSESIEELTHLRDDGLEQLQESSNLMNAKMNEANAVVDSQERWKVLFAGHLDHIENAGRELIGFYRSTNMGSRDTKPPAYFNKEWKLARPSLPEPGIDFLRVLASFKTESQAVVKVYGKCSSTIGAAYKVALETYQTIEELNLEAGACEKKIA